MVAQYGEITNLLSTTVYRMALVLTQHNLMLSYIDYILWQTDLNVVCTKTNTPPYILYCDRLTHHHTVYLQQWHTTITQSILVAEQHRILFLTLQSGTLPHTLYCDTVTQRNVDPAMHAQSSSHAVVFHLAARTRQAAVSLIADRSSFLAYPSDWCMSQLPSNILKLGLFLCAAR